MRALSSFSQATCFTDMAPECKSIIPYTSYPNEPLGLYDEEAYRNVTADVWAAAYSCNDTEAIIWGACNAIYPRCLMGFPLHLCRQTCLGKRRRSAHLSRQNRNRSPLLPAADRLAKRRAHRRANRDSDMLKLVL